MNRPRRNFDLPTKHINDTDGSDYAPPRARDPEEIARRKALRPGSLIREFQASGAKVAETIFNQPITEPEDINYIRRRLAAPLLNSAWYVFADSTKTPDIFMRRELKLPVLAKDRIINDNVLPPDEGDIEQGEGWRASHDYLVGRVRQGLAETVALSERLVIQYEQGQETSRVRTEKRLGRAMGNTALGLISLQHADAPMGMSEAEIQDIVLLDASELLEQARVSHERTGYHESVAQFADTDSPLAIDWRRHAPRSGQAYHAFIQAQADFGRTL